MAWTTTEFLTTLKRNVTVPSNQIRFTDADLLSMADEQMLNFMLPLITSIRQEFFVRMDNVALAAGQAEYKVPYRSVGRNLREIKVADSATSPSVIYPLIFISPEDTQKFLFNNQTGDARGYTMRGDNIVILPTPATGTSQVLQLYYELAPSRLVEASATGVVSSIASGAVTMAGAVTGFATGDVMDLVDYKSGNTAIAIDITNTDVTGAVVTFAVADLPAAPNALKAGDYVCLANQTPVLQIPNEAFFVLVQAVSSKVLEAQGDFEGMNAANTMLKKNSEDLERVLTPRVEADVPTIINQNGLIKNRMKRNWLSRYRL